MLKNFNEKNWKKYIPIPVCENHPEYEGFYWKAWELARDHVKYIDGMPQNPYMDEAFCETQVWIWDTCFMTLFCKFAQEVFPGVETFKNFYSVLNDNKLLPSVIVPNNEPGWTGAIPGRKKHIDLHIADNPPLFAWAEYENALIHGDKKYLKDLLYEKKSLQRHYDWFEGLKASASICGVRCPTYLENCDDGYKWEGGASGMDNTPRGRLGEHAENERPNNPNMLWLDAICQQALTALSISNLFQIVGDKNNESAWRKKYQEKKELINRLYWDKEDKFYYDIDCNDKHFYKVQTIASYWALTAEVADNQQACALLEKVLDDLCFGGEMPLVSLARSDKDFSNNGKYWRGSMWLPTAYATLKGLSRYGFHEETQKLSQKILTRMLKTYQEYEPHTIWECYSPSECTPGMQVDGKTVVRPDFCGWSALGPISVYIEYVLGFHTINAFENVVEWAKPSVLKGKIGIRNLRFGEIITDIIGNEKACKVVSNGEFTLKINDVSYQIKAGENTILL